MSSFFMYKSSLKAETDGLLADRSGCALETTTEKNKERKWRRGEKNG